MSLSHDQVTQLLRPINPRRVGRRDGMSHLEAYDVRAHLNRVLGFGEWSGDVLSMELLYEEPVTLKNGKDGYSVGYRCTYRLTIHATGATYTESATGDGQMPAFKRADAHDFAIKTAESQALKRCAINLGDQFGLSLYNQGSLDALVGRTLNMPAEPESRTAQQMYESLTVDEHVTEIAPETPAPQGEDAATAPSPATPAGQDTTHWAGIIRDRVQKEAPTKTGAARKTFLLKQLQEAAAKGVANATVADGQGGAMSLEKLITDAMRDA